MVEHLTSIFGTEKDRVNCPFYFNIGACRHGDRCSRFHTKPSISPTLLLSNIYQRPDMITLGVNAQGQPIDPRKMQEHFEVGNVYAQFREEEHAANVLKNPSGRFYAGRPIIVDFSPVTDFCGGYCNFMHLKRIGRELRRQLFGRYRRRHSLIRSRSQSPYRHRSYDDERTHGGRGHGSRRNDDRDYHRESRSKSYWSVSPGHRRGRSRSQRGRRNRSLIREGSEESRAKIEQWNRERVQAEQANKNNADNSNNYNESNDKGFIPNQQQPKHGGYRY